ncbi:hypothetical protein [Paenibacillus monticola]|uniref:Uncharacterized protein n=1 Tax=Paenibacillus monticola TaxID=2666075 RepID=A0A7X2H2C5_9BACL|nr:hypothetical protein [Paenibacillus monticola]MRN52272.1 hypothetical protein [Paenibacillus monticola]
MNKFKKISSKIITILLLYSLLISIFPNIIFAADLVTVDEAGSITFNTTSTQATTGIKYRTVGFTINRSPSCSADGQCIPQSSAHGEVRIQQVNEVPHGDNTVTTYFKVPEALVSKALEEAGL